MEEQQERESMMKRRLKVNGLKNKERMVKWHTQKARIERKKVDDEYEHKTNILKLSFDVHSNGLWVHWNDKNSPSSSDMGCFKWVKNFA